MQRHRRRILVKWQICGPLPRRHFHICFVQLCARIEKLVWPSCWKLYRHSQLPHFVVVSNRCGLGVLFPSLTYSSAFLELHCRALTVAVGEGHPKLQRSSINMLCLLLWEPNTAAGQTSARTPQQLVSLRTAVCAHKGVKKL